jgi:hypothetical protein
MCIEGSHLLDVVVTQGAAILKLLSGENQTLLIRWNSLLILDFGLDVIDSVTRLNLEGDGLARKGLDEAGDRMSVSLSPLAGQSRIGFVVTYICTRAETKR